MGVFFGKDFRIFIYLLFCLIFKISLWVGRVRMGKKKFLMLLGRWKNYEKSYKEVKKKNFLFVKNSFFFLLYCFIGEFFFFIIGVIDICYGFF